MSLKHLENLTAGKDGGTGEGVVLAIQDRMVDTDMAKVDVNMKADALPRLM